MRKAKADEKINEKILEMESSKYGMTVKELLDSIIFGEISNENLLEFAKKSKYDIYGIAVVNNSLEYFSINSIRGKQLLNEKYKKFLLTTYLDSVRKEYHTKIYLNPPLLPPVKMDGIEANYRGNLNSRVTFWLLSDLECDVCKEAKPIYEKIYEEYKSRVKFAFSYYSGDITLSSLALECANRQNKFWIMYDSLNNLKNNSDQQGILTIAKSIDLDMEKFVADMKDSITYHTINQNFSRISDQGFYGTPTIVINNKTILDAFSYNTISEVLEDELSKKD